MELNKYWRSWTYLQHLEPMMARHTMDSSKCITSVEICWLNMSRYFLMRKVFCSLFYGLFILFSIGCRDSKRGSDGSTGVAAEGKVEPKAKRLSEAEVVESAKQYARIYFQRCEQVGGVSYKKQEESFFTNGVFKPFAEFDKKLDRWAVAFTDGLNTFNIEMNADATRGALVASWFDIPDVPRVSTTGSDEKRPHLVVLKEFGEAVDRCKLSYFGK